MKLLFLLMVVTAGAQDAAEEIELVGETVVEVQHQQKNVRDLINAMLGLEFFLRDKKDHEQHCPTAKWTQPPLETYKDDPKSYLPEGCIPLEEEE